MGIGRPGRTTGWVSFVRPAVRERLPWGEMLTIAECLVWQAKRDREAPDREGRPSDFGAAGTPGSEVKSGVPAVAREAFMTPLQIGQ